MLNKNPLLLHRMKYNSFRGLQRYENEADPPGGSGGGESSTIKEMRTQLETANSEAQKAREKLETLETELNTLKRSRMDELTGLKEDKKELTLKLDGLTQQVAEMETLKSQNKKFLDFVNGMYNAEIDSIPEEHRERAKNISMREGDPLTSLNLLKDMKSMLGDISVNSNPPKQGNITQPGVTPNPSNKTENGKIDPKTVNWGMALSSLDERLNNQLAQRGQ